MGKPSSPCKGCDKRSVYCHDSCPAYLQFAEENAKQRYERHAEKVSWPYPKPAVNTIWRQC